MQQDPLGSAWLCNDALFALIGLYYVGVLLASLTLWPGTIPTILFAVPVITVSLRKAPQFVIGTALVSILVAAIDLFIEHPSLNLWALSFLTLVGIGFLATLNSVQRQQAVVRSQRQEERIRAVEQLRQPLTVIAGYAQILCSRPGLPTNVVVPLERINTAAKRLQQQIDSLLDERMDSNTRPPSHDTDSRLSNRDSHR